MAEREAAHVAIWHTLASGATVGWEGFGGVCKYYYDAETDTLYMPDLRGMFRAMAGDGIVAPSMGAVMGDRARNIWADFGNAIIRQGNKSANALANIPSGATVLTDSNDIMFIASDPTQGWGIQGFNGSRVVPPGAANVPRSWGSLPCAYFGQPSA